MPSYSIGVDLGGTNLRAAAVDAQTGEMLDKIAVSTDASGGLDELLKDIVTAVEQIRDSAGRDGLLGVGIGVPGFIDMARGVVIGSNNIPQLDGAPVRDRLTKMLGRPVILENDANAAALGEHWMGAGKGVSDLILITLGTGVGGGIIAGGKVLHGVMGMAGEIGHITVVPNGNPCGCGNYGCLEKHASATAIRAMAVLLGLPATEAKGVYDLAMHGNARAKMIFTSMGEHLGIALATLINIFNFPLYLIAGGPLAAWQLFSPPMLAEIDRRSFTYRHTTPRIEPATLGNQAGLFGAAYLPIQASRKS